MPDVTFAIVTLLGALLVFVLGRLVGGILEELGRATLSGFAPDITRAVARLTIRCVLHRSQANKSDLRDEIDSMIQAHFEACKTRSERTAGLVSMARQILSLVMRARALRTSGAAVAVGIVKLPPVAPEIPRDITPYLVGPEVPIIGDIMPYLGKLDMARRDLVRITGDDADFYHAKVRLPGGAVEVTYREGQRPKVTFYEEA